MCGRCEQTILFVLPIRGSRGCRTRRTRPGYWITARCWTREADTRIFLDLWCALCLLEETQQRLLSFGSTWLRRKLRSRLLGRGNLVAFDSAWHAEDTLLLVPSVTRSRPRCRSRVSETREELHMITCQRFRARHNFVKFHVWRSQNAFNGHGHGNWSMSSI